MYQGIQIPLNCLYQSSYPFTCLPLVFYGQYQISKQLHSPLASVGKAILDIVLSIVIVEKYRKSNQIKNVHP